ncbi:MAG TPA: sigma-54 dependent transcriptional regulator [Thermoanaerobaculia bacterium]|nr:sigma-54 dependent transcriptional regulator [Thermoanaerobaculia bacterium]
MSATPPRVLLVDDDTGLLRTIQVLLEDEKGWTVEAVSSAPLALEKLRASPFDVLLTDLSMPGGDGLFLLREARALRPDLPVLLMTAFGSVRSAVEAMKLGALQYLTKPVDPDELILQFERALESARLAAENRSLRERAGDPESFDILVGESAPIRSLRSVIGRLAGVGSTVLVRGETGTGKELVARLVHRGGPRSARPFVVVNCTAIPGELFESELFGHERGAFTGAGVPRVGRVEEADGGTLFLDEVGDMPAELQPKLLRFLQDRSYRRVGGARERAADVRVLAATHRPLEEAMSAGLFRPDLFHRLSTIPVHVVPLRERMEDLPLLAEHLLGKLARRLGRPRLALSAEALERLATYTFPGNVRELENLLERAVVLGGATSGEPIGPEAFVLPPSAGGSEAMRTLPLRDGLQTLEASFKAVERDLLSRALAEWPELAHAEIAARLGTSRRVLELRLEEHGLTGRRG